MKAEGWKDVFQANSLTVDTAILISHRISITKSRVKSNSYNTYILSNKEEAIKF